MSNKINFDKEVLLKVISQTIKSVPLVDFSKKPIVDVKFNPCVVEIKVKLSSDSYSVYNILSEVQDLIYYKLRSVLDTSDITVNVGSID